VTGGISRAGSGTNTSPNEPVLVVGAGPTGLLLAAELHRRGTGCRLVDDRPEPQHWDRATVLHPRTLEVFDALGILETFLRIGVRQNGSRLYADGTPLGETDLSNCGSRHGFDLGLSEEVTEAILTDYLHAQGGEVDRSARLTRLEANGDHVLGTIEHPDSVEQASFEWVIGCDGVHSVSRELSGISMNGHDVPQPWAVFDAATPKWPEAYQRNVVFMESVPVILTSLPDKRWRVYLRPTTADANLVLEATATVQLYHSDVTFEEVTNPRVFHCHSQVAERFRAGRVLLAGDAAHVCSPAEGHGMNTGIQDAFNLAWKLALVCNGRCNSDLLDSYEAERRPVAETVTRSGDTAENAQMLIDPSLRQQRNERLRQILAEPRMRHHEAVAATELDVDYRDSPIVMGDGNPALGPGQRLPTTASIRYASGTGMEAGTLDQLTRRAGHTAIVIGESSSTSEELAEVSSSLAAAADPGLIDATLVLAGQDDGLPGWPRLYPSAAQALGVQGITLLAVRPDGHVGLRAEKDHREALEAYQNLLTSGNRNETATAEQHLAT
jgi:2-polyprenyl-6-methoxyphenol hydroxylase-like FAD-dependent oxidoreductase